MNAKKLAEKDAAEYARAQMFFGEGAGIRRRIIEAKVSDLAAQDQDYAAAFDKALGNQSWSDHAAKAVKERKRIDRGKSIHQNTRALLTGNRRGASSTTIIVLMVAGYAAHETGLDKVVWEESKQFVTNVKRKYNERRNEQKRQNISSVH